MVEIIKIDSNTWRFEDDIVRFFLLEGEDKAAMIDSGNTCKEALELAKTLTDKEIILINTHGDEDHTAGTAAFSEIYIHERDYFDCGVDKQYPDTALKAVNDGDIIELGNRPLKIVHIPGHTKGSIAIIDVNNRTLYVGDTVGTGYLWMFGDTRDLDAFEPSLDKLLAMKDEYDVIYASHDEYKLPNDYTEKVKAAWKKVRAGEAEYKMIDLYGMAIKEYTLEDCGFYMM